MKQNLWFFIISLTIIVGFAGCDGLEEGAEDPKVNSIADTTETDTSSDSVTIPPLPKGTSEETDGPTNTPTAFKDIFRYNGRYIATFTDKSEQLIASADFEVDSGQVIGSLMGADSQDVKFTGSISNDGELSFDRVTFIESPQGRIREDGVIEGTHVVEGTTVTFDGINYESPLGYATQYDGLYNLVFQQNGSDHIFGIAQMQKGRFLTEMVSNQNERIMVAGRLMLNGEFMLRSITGNPDLSLSGSGVIDPKDGHIEGNYSFANEEGDLEGTVQSTLQIVDLRLKVGYIENLVDPLAAIIVGDEGERIEVSQKLIEGQNQLSSATLTTVNNTIGEVTFSEDGHPFSLETEGYLYSFERYTTTKVDVLIKTPEGSSIVRSIPWDPSILNDSASANTPAALRLLDQALKRINQLSCSLASGAIDPIGGNGWSIVEMGCSSFLIGGLAQSGTGLLTALATPLNSAAEIRDFRGSTQRIPTVTNVLINDGKLSTSSANLNLKLLAEHETPITAYCATERDGEPTRIDPCWRSILPTRSYSAVVPFALKKATSFTSETRTVTVWFQDSGGDIIADAFDSIRFQVNDLDRPNTLTYSINEGDATTNSTQVHLNVSVTDNNGVIAYYASENPEPPTSQSQGWVFIEETPLYEASVPFILESLPPSAVPNRSVYIWFQDAAGNVSTTGVNSVDSIDLLIEDQESPTEVSVSINDNDAQTPSVFVELTLAAKDNTGITGFYISEKPGMPHPNETRFVAVPETPSYNGKIKHTLSTALGSGTQRRFVYVWFTDRAGNLFAAAHDDILLKIEEIVDLNNAKVTINNGALRTSTAHLNAALSVDEINEVQTYYLSQSPLTPQLNWDGWKPYVANTQFSLRAIPDTDDHNYTLYAWFTNNAGVITPANPDSIIVKLEDIQPPTLASIAIENGDASTSTTTLEVYLSAEDNVGVTHYYLSESPTTPSVNGKWIDFPSSGNSLTTFFAVSPPQENQSQEKQLYAWFRDASGIRSTRASDSIDIIIQDKELPQNLDISINGNAEDTEINLVLVTISARDNVGLSAFHVSEDPNPIAPDAPEWQVIPSAVAYLSNVPFILSVDPSKGFGDYTKEVYSWFKDDAGNISETTTPATIILKVRDIEEPQDTEVIIQDIDEDGMVLSAEVLLSLAATDNVGVEFYCISNSPNTPSNLSSCWTSVSNVSENFRTTNIPHTLEPAHHVGTHPREVYVWFRDSTGNATQLSTPAQIDLYIDQIHAPQNATITVDTNTDTGTDTDTDTDTSTGSDTDTDTDTDTSTDLLETFSANVGITLSAEDNVGVSGYYLSQSPETPDLNQAGWVNLETPETNYINRIEYMLTGSASIGSHDKTLYVWFKNTTGFISAPVSQTVKHTILEAIAPYLTDIIVNKENDHAYGVETQLQLQASDNFGVTAYFVSEDNTLGTPSIDDPNWHFVDPIQGFVGAQIPYTLEDNTLEGKTVYVWFRDEVGNISQVSQDSIQLVKDDTQAPEIFSGFINEGTGFTTQALIRVAVGAEDDTGVIAYYISEDGSNPPERFDEGWAPFYTSTERFMRPSPSLIERNNRLNVLFDTSVDVGGFTLSNAEINSAARKEALGTGDLDDLPPEIRRLAEALRALRKIADTVSPKITTYGVPYVTDPGAEPEAPTINMWDQNVIEAERMLADLTDILSGITPKMNRPGLPYTLQDITPGLKEIYVWTMDVAGNISIPVMIPLNLVEPRIVTMEVFPLGTDDQSKVNVDTNWDEGVSHVTTRRIKINLAVEDDSTIDGFYFSMDPETPRVDDFGWQDPIAHDPVASAVPLGRSNRLNFGVGISVPDFSGGGGGDFSFDPNELFGTLPRLFTMEYVIPEVHSGEKTIYAWFKGPEGLISERAEISITMDITDPSDITIDLSSPTTGSTDTVTGRDVRVSISGTDDFELAAYAISNTNTAPDTPELSEIDGLLSSAAAAAIFGAQSDDNDSGWSPIPSGNTVFSTTVTHELVSEDDDFQGSGYRVVYVWFLDVAGNVSLFKHDSIFYDPPPTP